jgi:hypothetical protein
MGFHCLKMFFQLRSFSAQECARLKECVLEEVEKGKKALFCEQREGGKSAGKSRFSSKLISINRASNILE